MRKHKVLRVFLVIAIVLAALAAAWAIYYTHRSNPNDVVTYQTDNPAITGDTICVAHRSGSGVAPEETLAAFKLCTSSDDLDIGALEFDLHLTADNQLVLLHDDDLDRTSDSVEVFGETGTTVRSKTLAELKQLNMGAKFTAEDGSTPYAGLTGSEVPDDVRIATLDEVLDYLETQGDYTYIIEIKNSGEDGQIATDLLAADIELRGLEDRVFIGTFHDDVADYIGAEYPELHRISGTAETIDFYLAAITNRSNYAPAFDMVVLPYNDIKECYGMNSGLVTVTNYAHAHNIFVGYWTINTADEMTYLASIGADGIITDYPDIFVQTLR